VNLVLCELCDEVTSGAPSIGIPLLEGGIAMNQQRNNLGKECPECGNPHINRRLAEVLP
jgi:hypothetical protein